MKHQWFYQQLSVIKCKPFLFSLPDCCVAFVQVQISYKFKYEH